MTDDASGTGGRGAGRTVAVAAGGVLASAGLVAAVTLLARVTGFARWFAYSGSVGSTCVGEAYLTANQLPNVLFEVAAGGALAATVVPLVAGALTRGAADVDRIASALLTWAVVVLAPLSVVLALAAGPVTGALLGPQDCAGVHDLAVRMLLVFAPQVLLYGIGAVLAGILQAHRRFFWPALAPLLSSVVVIGCYLAFRATAGGTQDSPEALPAQAFWWLAGGTTAGVVAMTLPLLGPLRATGVRLRPTLRFPDGVAARARALVGAGLVALLAQQASVLVFARLANGEGTRGAIAVFAYVQAVWLLPYAVLAVPLATTAFPRLSARAAEGDVAGFADTAARTTRAVLLVAAAGAGVLVAAAPAVRDVFARIDTGAVTGMAPALTAMAPGLLGWALVAHAGRALYAVHAGREAAVATAGGWLVVTLVAVLAAPRVAEGDVVVVLGGATSVGLSVAGLALLAALRSRAGVAAVAGVPRTLAVTVLGAGLGALAGRLVADALLGAWGSAVGPAVAAGVLAAAACTVLVAATVALLDRGAVTAVRGVRA